MSRPTAGDAGISGRDVGPAAGEQRAYVAGMGMVTPIGVDTAMTLSSVRAGISQYAVSEYYSRDDKPITLAVVPEALFTSMEVEIDEGRHYSEQYDHIIKMAIVALTEALEGQTPARPIPLILAQPEPLAGVDNMPRELLIGNLLKQTELPLNPALIRTVHTGRAAGIQALELAFKYLFEAGEEMVLVGGSDSYLSYDRLDALDQERLNAPPAMDCFTPGEGAGFLLLCRDEKYALKQEGRCVTISVPAVTREPGHLYSDEPYLGEALDSAFKQVLKYSYEGAVTAIYSSMNGERYWSKEYGVAVLRNKPFLSEDFKTEHPADCYGDLGAATGAVLVGLAARTMLDEKGIGSNLVYGSSDSEWRAAVRLDSVALAKTR